LAGIIITEMTSGTITVLNSTHGVWYCLPCQQLEVSSLDGNIELGVLHSSSDRLVCLFGRMSMWCCLAYSAADSSVCGCAWSCGCSGDV